MTHLREHWEGLSLSGEYRLEQWFGGDDSAAFFHTSLAPDGRRAVVKLVPEAAVEGATPLDLWHRTRQLRHPNLIELLDYGRADNGGEIVLYAVFESPDDTLASALNRAPLNRQESREVLDSILEALRYLHAQGLVLGALDPDHIVAVGDKIKLSTDALRDADTSSAYRKDVRLLGDLWQQALMSASPKSSEIAAHAADPNPQARWTLAEISAALDPPLPAEPPPAPPLTVSSPMSEPLISVSPVVPVTPVSAPQVSAFAEVSPSPEVSSSPEVSAPPELSVPPAVVRKGAPALPPSLRRTPEPARAYPFPKWIFAGAAGVLLLILGLNRPRPAGVPTETRVAPVSLPAETRAPAPLPESAVPRVAVPKVAAPAERKPSPVAGKETAGKEMWRVIAFTYRTRDAAAGKVQQLNQYHPGLNATVFSPKDKGGYYLVSLGGRMTREEAVRLQRTARGKGLPRDLYVQNYSE
jgi:eukaryotic-like serine/threonine-protein kinase